VQLCAKPLGTSSSRRLIARPTDTRCSDQLQRQQLYNDDIASIPARGRRLVHTTDQKQHVFFFFRLSAQGQVLGTNLSMFFGTLPSSDVNIRYLCSSSNL